MSDQMRVESNLGTTEAMSSNAAEAAAVKTVSRRFKALGEKAKNVTRMVTQRAVLTGGVLVLLASSGCSNSEQPNTPTPAEPTPISSPIAETVRTPEKQALTDVEFVSNLLGTYLNLDADPQLAKLNDPNYLSSQLSKSIRVGSGSKQVPLGTFNSDSDYDRFDIEYRISSANMSVTVQERKGEGVVGKLIGFKIDKDGNVVAGGDSRLNKNEPVPARDEADKLVLSATRDVDKFLRNKPNEWSIDPEVNNWEMTANRGMTSNVNLPDGNKIEYHIGGTGEQPLDVSVFVTKGNE